MQTDAEVQALIDSGEPMVILYDVEADAYTAARPAADAVAARAPELSFKCLNNPAKLYQNVGGKQLVTCFSGAGSKSGSWGNATKHAAGSLTTTVWLGSGSGLYAAAGNTLVYSSPVTVVQVTRS